MIIAYLSFVALYCKLQYFCLYYNIATFYVKAADSHFSCILAFSQNNSSFCRSGIIFAIYNLGEVSLFLFNRLYYDVSVKSINCVCARTNKQFILIDTPNTENEIKWCEHAILWEFEVFKDCGNCIAMEQSGYISEWQNLLLTLTSLLLFILSYR